MNYCNRPIYIIFISTPKYSSQKQKQTQQYFEQFGPLAKAITTPELVQNEAVIKSQLKLKLTVNTKQNGSYDTHC